MEQQWASCLDQSPLSTIPMLDFLRSRALAFSWGSHIISWPSDILLGLGASWQSLPVSRNPVAFLAGKQAERLVQACVSRKANSEWLS